MKEETARTYNRALLAIMTLLITYFSVVSTFTNTRVSAIEAKVGGYEARSSESERNIAVILEKIKNIESLLMMMREEMRR